MAPTIVWFMGTTLIIVSLRPRVLSVFLICLTILLWVGPDATVIKLRWLLSGGESDRYILWKSGAGLLTQVPLLGFGPSSFQEILPAAARAALQYDSASSWHNDYLGVALENGTPVGLLFATGVTCCVIVSLRRSVRQRSRILIPGLTAGAGMIAATTSVISSAVLGAVWWVLLGACVGAMKDDSGRFDLG
jgi:O-antigen ligase